MQGGWFIGNFSPAVLKTDQFEVAYKYHKKGDYWEIHYHAQAIEVNYLIKGKMQISGKTLHQGDIFLIEKNEVSDPIFFEDCELIVVKVPSVINDKIIVS